MSQYFPLYHPTGVGQVIDPELLQEELARIAKAHNMHEPMDFESGSVLNDSLVAPAFQFLFPVRFPGSHALGAVTVAAVLADVGVPINDIHIYGGYAQVLELQEASARATLPVCLYKNTTLLKTVWMNNDTVAADDPSATYSLSGVDATLSQNDVLNIRASGNFATMRDVVFCLYAWMEHTV